MSMTSTSSAGGSSSTAAGVRIVVAGDRGTGKSTLIVTAATSSYPTMVPPVLPPTRMPEQMFPGRVPVTVIDTSYSVENRGKHTDELQKADAVVLTCACDQPATLERLSSFWLPELRRLEVKVPVIVAGCKLDLIKDEQQHSVSLEQWKSPIMQQFPEVETWIECSAYKDIQIPKAFYYSQKAVLYPTTPLFDKEAKTLKPRCVRALKRIFSLCDNDRDSALSDSELNDLQVKCFNAPWQPLEIAGVKRLAQQKLPEGVDKNGLTLAGFLSLHALFIEKGRLEKTWTVLRKFGYTNEIRLLPPIKRTSDQSVELTSEAVEFLRGVFSSFDKDGDGALNAQELDDVFSTAPESPWNVAPYANAAENNALGGLSLDGFLAKKIFPHLTAAPLPRGSSYAAALLKPREPDMGQATQPSIPKVNNRFKQLSLSPRPEQFKRPRRPERGSASTGTLCHLKANHFLTELSATRLFMYRMQIIPQLVKQRPILTEDVILAVMERFVNSHCDNMVKGSYVFDGRPHIITSVPLLASCHQGKIQLQDETTEKWTVYEVSLLREELVLENMKEHFEGLTEVLPYSVVQALNAVLSHGFPAKSYYPAGSRFCSESLGSEPLGRGLICLRGFHQSMKHTQNGLSLIVDSSSSVFLEALPVIEFVGQLLCREDVTNLRISEEEATKIQELLTGYYVEVGQLQYKVSTLTSLPTSELMRTKPEFFKRTKYAIGALTHMDLPCLITWRGTQEFYLPMEVCSIVKGQRLRRPKLDDTQFSNRRNATRQRPEVKEAQIKKTVSYNGYDDDIYAKEFGLKVNKELTDVVARVLSPPELQYQRPGTQNRKKTLVPVTGQWNMTDKRFLDGGTVKNWMCINLDEGLLDEDAQSYCKELARVCNGHGMKYEPNPVHHAIRGTPGEVEKLLKRAMAVLNGKEPHLLVVILPTKRNGLLYGEVKRICETQLDILSQCCRGKTAKAADKRHLSHMALKINAKTGGRNFVLSDALSMTLPNVGDVPTIIFGADVTHHTPGSSPSIAALVATCDWPEMTKYKVLIRSQDRGDDFIRGLHEPGGGMITEHIRNFVVATGQVPQKIIFYRDGGSEKDFEDILKWELGEIRKACLSLREIYKPAITFIAVQKRHHTRLFAKDHNDTTSVDAFSGNILPGTVVDSQICHPTEFDFYLCSHAGYKGTSRPAHYIVLHDDSKFKSDDLQLLTNSLCYTFARGTRSISIVPAIMYAHLAAYRARVYLTPGQEAATALPPVKQYVKGRMYFC